MKKNWIKFDKSNSLLLFWDQNKLNLSLKQYTTELLWYSDLNENSLPSEMKSHQKYLKLSIHNGIVFKIGG
jgi:hypothetical protein